MTSASHASCRFQFDGEELLIANPQIERRWKIAGQSLFATGLMHVPTNTQWITRPAPISSPCVGPQPRDGLPTSTHVTSSDEPLDPVQRQDTLVVTLTAASGGSQTVYRFQTFAESPAITIDVTSSAGPTTQPVVEPPVKLPAAPSTSSSARKSPATKSAPPLEPFPQDLLEAFHLSPPHLRFVTVTFYDRTDVHNNLVFEQEWLLHPNEPLIQQRGNLFVVENVLSGEGLIFLKHAPLPDIRPIANPLDVIIRGNWFTFRGHGLGPDGGAGYPFATIVYSGGVAGRTAALHQYQRQLHPYLPGRDGLLLTNTWGDQSRASKIAEPFLLAEVDAGAKLGADVFQIDDGWQAGQSSNTGPGGRFSSFWDVPGFWNVNSKRLPNGLKPVADATISHGLQFGLWYSPDSSDDFANWEKDANCCLDLHRDEKANFIKIDSVKFFSKQGEINYHRFLRKIMDDSQGRLHLDLDVTAGMRPGYFGTPAIAPLFVENRYTDLHRYWPHHTLRNLWMLAKYIDPMQLRMEFLNNARHTELYKDDPLAPAAYDPAHLFATVMFSSPLGWFETSGLSQAYIESAAPLIKVWKTHRDAMLTGEITPIGQTPTGVSWTGFRSRAADGSNYLLIFREMNDRKTCKFPVPGAKAGQRINWLFSPADVVVQDGQIELMLEKPLSFTFFKLT